MWMLRFSRETKLTKVQQLSRNSLSDQRQSHYRTPPHPEYATASLTLLQLFEVWTVECFGCKMQKFMHALVYLWQQVSTSFKIFASRMLLRRCMLPVPYLKLPFL